MRLPAAIEVALMLIDRPSSVRWVSRMPLPSGVTLLLEIATGDLTGVQTSSAIIGRSAQVLQSAAIFFIEQVLFTQEADSYRVLGCRQTSTRRQLRRHMALLIKLLHPDHQAHRADKACVDRSVYFYRVTKAWQELKSAKQRAAYDRGLSLAPCRSDGQFGLQYEVPTTVALGKREAIPSVPQKY